MAVVLYFGNPDIPGDALAVELGRSLEVPGFRFVYSRSPEEIIDYLDDEVYVMDVASGISKVSLVIDPAQVQLPPRLTAHDIDPALFLRLTEQLYGVKVPVIALPMGGDREAVREQVIELLATLRAGKNGGHPG